MRTTLDIDDDLLAAAKELARRENISAGQVVSRLMRQGLTSAPPPARPARSASAPRRVAGFRPFTGGGQVVTNELVNELRDAEGI